jgi:hypothetical protein
MEQRIDAPYPARGIHDWSTGPGGSRAGGFEDMETESFLGMKTEVVVVEAAEGRELADLITITGDRELTSRLKAAAERITREVESEAHALYEQARSMGTFEGRFPSEDDIIQRICMELVPLERPLPERIERILEDVPAAEHQKQEAEAEKTREQKRLIEVERHFREEQLRQLEEERCTRERILREAIDPQVRQAQEIVAQVQASLLRLAQEIASAIAGGAAVSPATRRSWGLRLEALASLAPGNLSFEQALDGLRHLSKTDAAAGRTDATMVDRKIHAALRDLERRAAIEMCADLIWQLMKEGRAEEALRRVAGLQERLSDSLSEVEALWEMVMEVGAQNQILQASDLELQPQA